MKEFRVKKTVTLPSADLEWFEIAYDGFELSAMLTLLLHSFRQEHETIGLTPLNASQSAAKTLVEEIKEGLIDGVREAIKKQ